MDKIPRVAICLLGTTLDAGPRGSARWERWRPTVALCQHPDLLLDRLELLYQPKFQGLAEQIIQDIGSVSPETKVRPHALELHDPWSLEEVYASLRDFALSYAFRPDRERYLIHITTGSHIAQICLFLLTETRYLPGQLIQSSPPERRNKGEPGSYSIIDLDLSKYDLIASRFSREQKEGLSFLKSGIDTRNHAFNQMIERIEKVALASRSPILLTGPTGAGKSLLAKRIYELKKRRRLVEGDLVELNCATLRGDAAMSALFGHVKGAFTGAIGERVGLLRKAQGGLLFLDEIGELGLDEQAMLLRAIEEKTFLPVGSDREVVVDFQLIAGTNRDLARAVAQGRFREDLLSRIDLWAFRLPGLVERREDIAPNLDYELERCSAAIGTRLTMNTEARERFLRFACSSRAVWRGNFRDLNAAVMRMGTLAQGGRITEVEVEEEAARLTSLWAVPSPERGADLVREILGEGRASTLDRFDRAQLEEVLAISKGARSLSEAGRVLFAESRKQKKSSNDADRLRKYLARFGLSWAEISGEKS